MSRNGGRKGHRTHAVCGLLVLFTEGLIGAAGSPLFCQVNWIGQAVAPGPSLPNLSSSSFKGRAFWYPCVFCILDEGDRVNVTIKSYAKGIGQGEEHAREENVMFSVIF